jgi:tripartite-type tricarboxylate transporter receptor subunit TctC
MIRRMFWLCAVLALAGISPAVANNHEITQFYKDKRLSVIVGYPAGGGFDAYARLLNDHLGRFLPGAPKSTIQYMPGAATLKSVGYIYNVAAQDGTVIGIPSTYLTFNAFVRGEVGEGIDVTRIQWIGRLAPMDIVTVVWHGTGIRSFADLSNRPIHFGGTSAGGGSTIIPYTLNRVFGTKIDLVMGYVGTTDQYLAMERGEIQGMSNAIWSQLERSHPQWIAERKIVPLLQDGFARRNALPDVPTIVELGKNDEDRRLLRLIGSSSVFGRSFYVGPKVPEERVRALRTAFTSMVNDAEFKATAAKINVYLEPLSGDELQATVAEIATYPKELFKRTHEMTQPLQGR